MKKRSLTIVFAALLTAITATAGIGVLASQAATPNYFSGLSIGVNAPGYASAYVFSKNVVRDTAQNAYEIDKAVYYTDDVARPTTLTIKMLGLTGATAVSSVNGGATSAVTEKTAKSIAVTADGAAIVLKITFRSGSLDLQSITINIAVAEVASDELYSGGDGTEANPYIITEAWQLDNARYFLSSHFKLAADINLGAYQARANDEFDADAENHTWRTLGYSEITPFDGTFKGDGYKISGFKGYDGGLFNYVTGKEISGIVFDGVSYESTKAVSNSGVLAYSTINTKIKDIAINNGRFTSRSTVTGGLVSVVSYTTTYDFASDNTPIRNIAVNMGINSPDYADADTTERTGGLFATVTGNSTNRILMRGISVTGGITASGRVGGIAAEVTYANLSDAEYKGNISLGRSSYATWHGTGGLIGTLASGSLGDNLTVEADFTVIPGYNLNAELGGFVGRSAGTTPWSIGINAEYTGSITAPGLVYLGGFVGDSATAVAIATAATNAAEGAKVTMDTFSARGFVGGIIGWGTTVDVGRYADVRIGGLITAPTAANSYAYAGGVAGYTQGAFTLGANAKINIDRIDSAGYGLLGGRIGGIFGNVNAVKADIGADLTLNVGSITVSASPTGSVGAIGGAAWAQVIIGDGAKSTVNTVEILGASQYIGAAGVGYIYPSLASGDALTVGDDCYFEAGSVRAGAVGAQANGSGGAFGTITNPAATIAYANAAFGDGTEFRMGYIELTGQYIGGAIGQVGNNLSIGDNLTANIDFVKNAYNGAAFSGGFLGMNKSRYASGTGHSAAGIAAVAADWTTAADLKAANTIGAGMNVTVSNITSTYAFGGFAGAAMLNIIGGTFKATVTQLTATVSKSSVAGFVQFFYGEAYGLDIETVVDAPNSTYNGGVFSYLREGSVFASSEVATVITGTTNLGGVAAATYAGNKIYDLTVTARITGTSVLGGVAGSQATDTVIGGEDFDLTVTADITGTSTLGGVIGTQDRRSRLGGTGAEKVKVAAKVNTVNGSYIGGAIGTANGASNNVEVTAEVAGGSSVGGFAGSSDNYVATGVNNAAAWDAAVLSGFTDFTGLDCISNITVKTGTAITCNAPTAGDKYIGGLIGFFDRSYLSGGTVEAGVKFNVYDSVLAYSSVGGGFGAVGSSNSLCRYIEELDITANIAANGSYIGGVAGRAYRATFGGTNTVNATLTGLAAAKTANSYYGGFAGIFYGGTAGADYGVHTAEGSRLTGASTTVNSVIRFTGIGQYVGGLFGSFYDAATVDCADVEVNTVISAASNGTDSYYLSSAGLTVGYMYGTAVWNAASLTITPDSRFLGAYNNIGGFAGYLAGLTVVNGHGAVISNTVESSYNSSNVGGVIGQMSDGRVNDITFGGKVSAYANNTGAAGGFVGMMYRGVISDCAVTKDANVYTNGVTYVGGFLGIANPNTTQARQTGDYNFVNCYSAAPVTAVNPTAGGSIGGFLGYALYIGARGDCYSTGDVTVTVGASSVAASQHIGGFAGYINGSASTSFNSELQGARENDNVTPTGYAGVYSTGNISVNHAAGLDVSNIGGLVGVGGYNTEIGNGCYSTGNITTNSGTYIGGFIGQSQGYILGDCRAYGTITVTVPKGTVGGFTGYYARGHINATSKYAPPSGYILTANTVGGWAGIIQTNSVTNEDLGGNVVLDGAECPEGHMTLDVPVHGTALAGGLAASLNLGCVKNVWADAPVTASANAAGYVGGLLGEIRTLGSHDAAGKWFTRVESCRATANNAVTTDGVRWVGGMIGQVNSSGAGFRNYADYEVLDCEGYNTVSVFAAIQYSYVGGIIGNLNYHQVRGLSFYGHINVRQAGYSVLYVLLGGIVGVADGSRTVLTTTDDSVYDAANGHMRYATITECYFDTNATIDARVWSGSTGGIVGYTATDTIDCESRGDIFFAGSTNYGTGSIAGTISTNGYTAPKIYGCLGSGDITAPSGTAGGLVGQIAVADIQNSYYESGTVTGLYAGAYYGDVYGGSLGGPDAANPLTVSADVKVVGYVYAGGFIARTAKSNTADAVYVATGLTVRYVRTYAEVSIINAVQQVFEGGLIAWYAYGTVYGCEVGDAANKTALGGVGLQYGYIGGLIGYSTLPAYTDGGTANIYDCKAYADINAADGTGWIRAGGFIGYLGGYTIAERCYAYGDVRVTNQNASSSTFVGGFAGGTSTAGNRVTTGNRLTECAAYGDVYIFDAMYKLGVKADGASYAGGFAGNAGDVITDCAAYGGVSGRAAYMGGFAGYVNTAWILNGVSYGDVTAAEYVEYIGGFAGLVPEPGVSVFGNLIAGSASYGDVYNNASVGSVYTGGFVGRINASTGAGAGGTRILDNASFGKVYIASYSTVTNDYAGGFVGYINNSVNLRIDNCYAFGIESLRAIGAYATRFGGFIGAWGTPGDGSSITNCFFTDAVYMGTRQCAEKAGYGDVSYFTVAPEYSEYLSNTAATAAVLKDSITGHSIDLTITSGNNFSTLVLGDEAILTPSGTNGVENVRILLPLTTYTAGLPGDTSPVAGATRSYPVYATPVAASTTAQSVAASELPVQFEFTGALTPVPTPVVVDALSLSADISPGAALSKGDGPATFTVEVTTSAGDVSLDPTGAELLFKVSYINDFTAARFITPEEAAAYFSYTVTHTGDFTYLTITPDANLRSRLYIQLTARAIHDPTKLGAFAFAVQPSAYASGDTAPVIGLNAYFTPGIEAEGAPVLIYTQEAYDLGITVTNADDTGFTVISASLTVDGNGVIRLIGEAVEGVYTITVISNALNAAGQQTVLNLYVKAAKKSLRLLVTPTDGSVTNYTAAVSAVAGQGIEMFFDIFNDSANTVEVVNDAQRFADITGDGSVYADGVPLDLITSTRLSMNAVFTLTFTVPGAHTVRFVSADGYASTTVIFGVTLPAPTQGVDFAVQNSLSVPVATSESDVFYEALTLLPLPAQLTTLPGTPLTEFTRLEIFDEVSGLWKALTTTPYAATGRYTVNLRYAQYTDNTFAAAKFLGASGVTQTVIRVIIEDSANYPLTYKRIQTLTGEDIIINPIIAPFDAVYTYQIDGGEVLPVPESMTISALDGETVSLFVYAAGVNVPSTPFVAAKLAVTPPANAFDVRTSYAYGVWTSSDVIFLFEMTLADGFGYYYRFEGASEWTELITAGYLLVAENTDAKISFRAYNAVSDKEYIIDGVTDNLSVRIDKSASIGVELIPPVSYVNSPALDTVIINLSDIPFSSVTDIEWYKEGEAATHITYTGMSAYAFDITSNGKYYVTVTDALGRKVTRSVEADIFLPSLTGYTLEVAGNPTSITAWYNSITLEMKTIYSGSPAEFGEVNEWRYSVDGENTWSDNLVDGSNVYPYFDVPAVGNYIFIIYNKLGQTLKSASISVSRLDNRQPTLDIGYDETKWISPGHNVSITVGNLGASGFGSVVITKGFLAAGVPLNQTQTDAGYNLSDAGIYTFTFTNGAGTTAVKIISVTKMDFATVLNLTVTAKVGAANFVSGVFTAGPIIFTLTHSSPDALRAPIHNEYAVDNGEGFGAWIALASGVGSLTLGNVNIDAVYKFRAVSETGLTSAESQDYHVMLNGQTPLVRVYPHYAGTTVSFTLESPGTLVPKLNGALLNWTLQYSIDGGAWATLDETHEFGVTSVIQNFKFRITVLGITGESGTIYVVMDDAVPQLDVLIEGVANGAFNYNAAYGAIGFALFNPEANRSGTTYQYSLDYADLGDATAAAWITLDGDTLILNTTLYSYITFRSISGFGIELPEASYWTSAGKLIIDKTVGVSISDAGSGWTNQDVTLDLTTWAGAYDAGTDSYKHGGFALFEVSYVNEGGSTVTLSLLDGSNLPLAAFDAPVNGLYTFTIRNNFGTEATETFSIVNRIDKVGPKFDVHTLVPLPAPGTWLTSSITFIFTDVLKPISGVTYYFRLLDYTLHTTAIDWTLISNNSAYVSNHIISSYTHGYLQFKAVSASGNETDYADAYNDNHTYPYNDGATPLGFLIQLNNSRPTVTVSGAPSTTVYVRADSWDITVITNFGLLPGKTYVKINGVRQTSPIATATGSVIYTLTANAIYTFYAVLDSESTVLSDEVTVNTGHIDFIDPTFSVTPNNYPGAVWSASDGITFTVTPTAQTVSGAKYYYEVYNTVSGLWESHLIADYTYGAPGAFNPVSFSVNALLDSSTQSFNGKIRFRALANSTDAAAVISSEYELRLDQFTPTIVFGSVPSAGTWITAAYYRLSITTTFGESAGSYIQVFRDGTLLTVPVTPADTYYDITANGVYVFILTSGAGTATTEQITVGFMDNLKPEFTVSTNWTVNWTSATVYFEFTTVYKPTSGIVYEVSLTGSAADYTVIPGSTAAGALIQITASFSGTVLFRVSRASSAGAASDYLDATLLRTYAVKIDKTTPVLTANDLIQDGATPGVTVWTTGSVDITITATASPTFAASVIQVYVSTDGTNFSALINGTGKHTLTANGDYWFRAQNGALVVSNVVKIELRRIETANPTIAVRAYTGTDSTSEWTEGTLTGWTYKDIRFTLASSVVLGSGTIYQYSFDGVTWTTLANGTSAWGKTSADSLIINVNRNATVYFRALAGRDAAKLGTAQESTIYFAVPTPSSYAAQIDKTAPTLTAVPSTTAWTLQDVIVALTAQYGAISAGASGNVILISTNKANMTSGTSVVALTGVAQDYIVSVNGNYYFQSRSAAGLTSEIAELTISNIDDGKTPSLQVAATGGFVSGTWRTGTVRFDLSITSGTKPLSGIRYEYQESADGLTWGSTWSSLTSSADAASLSYITSVDTFVQFRVVAGRAAGTPSGADATYAGPYSVRIDQQQPTLIAADEVQDAAAPGVTVWTTGQVTITLTPAFSTPGEPFGYIEVSTNAGVSWTRLSGFASDNPTYAVSANGTYYFRAVNPALTASTTNDSVVTVGRIHTSANPQIAVSSTGTLDAWTKNNVEFNLSYTGPVQLSGVDYWYNTSATFAADAWVKLPGSTYTFNATGNVYVKFRATSRMAPGTMYTETTDPYHVMIDKDAVTFSAAANDAVWTTPTKTVTFSGITNGPSGVSPLGKILISTAFNGTYSEIGNIDMGTYAVSAIGTYYFKAVSASGMESAPKEVIITKIDNTTAPVFTTTPSNPSGAWTRTPVTFTLNVTAKPVSGVSLQYQESADGTTWDDTWFTVSGDGAGDEYVRGYSAASKLFVRFRAITGRGVTSAATAAYAVRIDPTQPTITATVGDQSAYTTENREITVTVTAFGISLGQAASIVEVSSDGGNTWASLGTVTAVGQVFLYAAADNITYSFRATSAADYPSAVREVTVERIDRVMPDINVAAQNAGSWTSGDVTFTLSTTVTPGSGVYYQYSLNGTDWFEVTDEDDAPTNTITFDGSFIGADNLSDDFTIRFRAYAGRDRASVPPYTASVIPSVSADSASYLVRIDKTVPTVTVDASTSTAWVLGSAVVNFAVTFGPSGAAGAVLERAFGIDSDSQYSAVAAVNTFTVTQNGTYFFRLKSATSVYSAAPNGSITVTWLDTDVNPDITVTQNQTPASGWTSGSVEFTAATTAANIPSSGVVYQYRENGVGNWITFTGTKTYADNADITVEFRAFAGRYLPTPPSDKIDQKGPFAVKIDKATPTVKITAGIPSSDTWITSATLSLEVKTGISLADGDIFVSIGGAPGVSIRSLFSSAYADGVYTLIGSYAVVSSDTYYFYAVSGAELTSARVDSGDGINYVEITKIDSISPEFTVDLNGYAVNTWTGSAVTFNLTGTVGSIPQSGIFYMYRLSTDGVWTPLAKTGATNNAVYTISANFLGTVEFIAYAGMDEADKLTKNYARGPYTVKIDMTTPTVNVKGVPTDWTNEPSVTLTLYVVFGASAAEGRYYVDYDYIDDDNIQRTGTTALTGQTTYSVEHNGTYYFYAVSVLGVESVQTAWTSASGGTGNYVEITKMDNKPAKMKLGGVPAGTVGAWTASPITFTLIPETSHLVPASGINYRYSLDDGATWFDLAKGENDMAILTIDATFLTAHFGTPTTSYRGTLRFKSYAGSDQDKVGNVFATPYSIMYDASVPTAVINAASIPVGYQSQDYYITVSATFGLQGGSIWYNGASTAAGGTLLGTATTSEPTALTVNYLVNRNGEFNFYAVSANGTQTPVGTTLNLLEKWSPEFSVSPTEDSGAIGVWTLDAVSFEIVVVNPEYSPVSGVRYFYQLSNEDGIFEDNWIEIVADGGRYIATFSDSMNVQIQFMARANATQSLTTISNNAFDIMIDSVEASITVTGNPGDGEWVNIAAAPTRVLHVERHVGASGIEKTTVQKDGGAEVLFNADDYPLSNGNGTYVFRVYANNGSIGVSAPVIVTRVDLDPPRLTAENGIEKNAVVISGDVTITVEGEFAEVTVTRGDGKTAASSYSDAVRSMTFSATGTYTVRVVDRAGNTDEFTFTISKPNYALIGSLSAVGALMLGFIAFMAIRIVKNQRAFKRLTGSTTSSDDANQFMMFKKVK